MPAGDAEKIHRFLDEQVQEARSHGASTVTFRVGDIRDVLHLTYSNAAIDVGQVLSTIKLQSEARLELLDKRGSGSSLDSTYRFRLL